MAEPRRRPVGAVGASIIASLVAAGLRRGAALGVASRFIRDAWLAGSQSPGFDSARGFGDDDAEATPCPRRCASG